MITICTSGNLSRNNEKSRAKSKFARPSSGFRALSVLCSFAVLQLNATTVLAATSTWTGPGGTTGTPVTGNWNTSTNWSPSGIPASSTATTLIFGGSGSTAYTSTNNIASLFTFGTMTLNSTASAAEIIAGSSFNIDGSQIQQTNSGAFTIQNAFDNSTTNATTTLTLAGNGTGLVTLSGIITEKSSSKLVALVKTGTSTFELTGNNSYTGGATIQAGTILIGNSNALGTGGTVLLGHTTGTSAANLLTTGAFTVGRAITLQSGNTGVMTLGGNTAAASSFTGAVLLGNSGALARNASFVALAGGSVDFSGVINENTGIAASSVTIGDATHAGTVKFSNVANAYAGATTIGNGSTLEVTKLAAGASTSSIGNSGSAAAAGSVATDLVIDNGTLKYTGTGDSTNRLFTIGTGGATIDASAAANAALNFTGTGSLAAGTTGGRTLTLTGGSTGANTLTSVIANPTTSGATALTKSGAGTWVLGGANTYAGATTITAGTLALGASGSFNNSPTITVGNAGSSGTVLDLTAKASFAFASTQTVNGIGTINIGAGKTVTNNGVLAPGNSIGTLSVTGNYTFGSTSAYQVETDATSSDRIAISGAATISSGAGITFSGSTGLGKYVLATAASGLNSGTFSGTVPTNYRLGYSAAELALFRLATVSIAASGSNPANVHVGSVSLGVTLSNTAPVNSDALFYSLDNGLPGNATGLAAGSNETKSGMFTAVVGSNTFTVTATPNGTNPATNGPVSTNLAVTGYRLATVNTISTPVTLTNIHVGGTFGTSALSIKNTQTNDAFSEKLNAAFGALTGFASTNSGTITTLAAGSTDGTAMTVGLGGGVQNTAGTVSGTAVVSLLSNGSGTSGLGTSSLAANGSQTITISGGVYRLATVNTISTPVTLTNIHVGGTFGTSALSITNTQTNDAFSERLDAAFGALTGFASTNSGTITTLAAGSSDSTAMTVGLGGGVQNTAGAVSGTAVVSLLSNGSGTSGLGTSSLAAGGNQTITINGGVYRLATVNTISTPVTLANIHVGGTFGTSALTLTNTQTNDAFSEKLDAAFGTLIGSASTNSGTITALAAGSSDSTAMTVGLGGGVQNTAGAVSGTAVVSLLSNGSGTSGLGTSSLAAGGNQTITISGGVYRLATVNTISTPVTLTNIHVGGTFGTSALSITNTQTNDAFSEKLDAAFGALTGFASTNSGTITTLAAGSSDSTAMTVGLGGGVQNTAGTVSGTAVVSLLSNGSGTSGLGTGSLAANGSQTITISGGVYRLATAGAHTPYPVAFGNFHVGNTLSQALTIGNTAINDAFSEKLNASIAATSGSATASGSFTLLAPGSNNTASLLVGLNTSSAGVLGGTATITLTSDGTGTSGLANTGLGTQTVNLTGTGYRLAAVNTISTPVTLGNIRVGGTFGTAALSITNTQTNDAFSEKLDAAFGTLTGSASTNSGTITTLAAGSSDSTAMTVGLGGGVQNTAGAVSGTAVVSLLSNGSGTSGLASSSLAANGTQTITISGGVYRLATAGAHTPDPVAFGNVHVNATSPSQSLTINNTAANDGFSEALNGSIGGATAGVTTSGSFSGIAPGSSSSALTVGIDTSTIGVIAGTATLGLTSDGAGSSGLGTTSIGTQTVNVTANVYSGAGVWNTSTSGNWSNFSSWTTAGGAPGLDAAFQTGSDTATFGTTSGPVTVTLNGGSASVSALTFNNSAQSYTIANTTTEVLKLNNQLNSAVATVTNSAGNHTISAPVELHSSVAVSVAAGSQLTVSGTITTGTGTLTKDGAGTLALSGANTHSGATVVSGGTLALGNLNAVQNSTLDTGTAGLQDVTFTVAGTYNLGGLSGADALNTGTNSLSVGANNANTTFTGDITAAALTKVGTGTLDLNGTNQTYNSLTANNGTTNVNGSLTTGTAAVTVNNSAGGTKLRFGSVSQTLSSLTIGAGATVIFTSGTASGSFSGGGAGGKAAGFGGSAVVPEPGTIGLLLVGALGMLNRRRRQA